MAKSSTSFRKGQSGNPGGRPNLVGAVQELARERTEEAIDTLVTIMGDAKAPPAARVAASNAILDRGWGRPNQPIEADVSDPIRQLLDAVDGATRRTPSERNAADLNGHYSG